jgi:hypothetical protein
MGVVMMYRVRCNGACRRWLCPPPGRLSTDSVPHYLLRARPGHAHAVVYTSDKEAIEAASGAGWVFLDQGFDRVLCPDCRENALSSVRVERKSPR